MTILKNITQFHQFHSYQISKIRYQYTIPHHSKAQSDCVISDNQIIIMITLIVIFQMEIILI